MSADITQLMASSSHADTGVYTPVSLKIAAMMSGYAGVTHAVGPVWPLKGSA